MPTRASGAKNRANGSIQALLTEGRENDRLLASAVDRRVPPNFVFRPDDSATQGDQGIKSKLRINEDINAREIRLIGENSEQLGIVSKEEALLKARAAGLDLCEIAANAKPPVCKLMDFGKYKYEMQKKVKEARKKQKVIHVKEVKLSPKINEHDYVNKFHQVERFISEGDKVKVTMVFRGREGAHPEFGTKIVNRLVEDIRKNAQIDRMPKQEGNQLSVILSPMSVTT